MKTFLAYCQRVVTAEVDVTTWPRLPVFTKLQEWGNVAWPEMYRTFNMGIGMILIVDENDVETVKENLGNRGEAVYEIWPYRKRRWSCCP